MWQAGQAGGTGRPSPPWLHDGMRRQQPTQPAHLTSLLFCSAPRCLSGCRGLALLHNVGVVSASHDQTLKARRVGAGGRQLWGCRAAPGSCCCNCQQRASRRPALATTTPLPATPLPPHPQVWTLSGECIAELVGHTALVYVAAATFDGLVASGSEDNTARLWHADGTCLQVRLVVGVVGGRRGGWLGQSRPRVPYSTA